MSTTSIEWTDVTWNPTTGCDRVSPGCDNCYALTMAKRLKGMGTAKYQNDGDPRTSGPGFLATEHADTLAAPLQWRKPRRVFVNSMSDLFHERISDEFIAKVFGVMAHAGQHTFQVLTKRHGRMRSLLNNPDRLARLDPGMLAHWIRDGLWPLRNVWLGVSVENQKWANTRIPALLDTPAAVRFLSCEPLLGPVDLRASWIPSKAGPLTVDDMQSMLRWPDSTAIDWVIVGGESGPGARPMHPNWARSLRDQCQAANVAFLVKQWGEWAPAGLGIGMAQHNVGHEVLVGPRLDDLGQRQVMRRVGKRSAGRELDGRTWDEFPVAVGR